MSELLTETTNTELASSTSEAALNVVATPSATEGQAESTGQPSSLELFLGEFSYEGGFLGFGTKERFSLTQDSVSLERSDVASLSEDTDDFGNTFTVINLNEESSLVEEVGESIYVASPLAAIQSFLNN